MLLTGLHPIGWHGPNLFLEVDLTPLGTDRLTSAIGVQDRELQRASEILSLSRNLTMNAGTSA
jgi:hypothetical protein